jgi:hypothetical protein
MYESSKWPVLEELRTVSPREFLSFDVTYQESSMVLAYSWLESFLDDVDEAFYLMDPTTLGDQLQVKLGKILESKSVEELLHDIIRRRVRDRSQWSLLSRLKDLRDRHEMQFSVPNGDIEWMTRRRNQIVHDRRIGKYQVKKRRVTYESVSRETSDSEETERFLRTAANVVVDLYENTARALGITARFKLHHQNLEMIASWRGVWSRKASASGNPRESPLISSPPPSDRSH